MSILLVGKFYTESFAQHIGEALERLGHSVIRLEVGLTHRPHVGRIRRRWHQAATMLHEAAKHLPLVNRLDEARLCAAARSASIDLTIVCHDFLLPAHIDALKGITGAPIALWYPDSIWSFGRALFLNARYDALFFKDPYIVHRLGEDLEQPAFYLPECCNPMSHRVVSISEADQATFGCDIATAGNLYSYRVAFFEHLTDYNVRIWGNPPPSWLQVRRIRGMLQGRYVVHEEKAKAFLCAKTVVNNLHAGEIWGLNARAFEIAASGGFQFISWRPALDQLFSDGTELVSFRSIDDLRAKLDHYLTRPDEREAIARAGRERAHRDHTYERRLSLLLNTVAGAERGFPLPDVTVSART